MKRKMPRLTRFELALWIGSILTVLLPFLIFDREGYMSLIASLIGVSALIFCAKGHPVGQLLVVIFSFFYGVISYVCAYYGEMITYMGMSLPMAVASLVSWLKNPYGDGSEVTVGKLSRREKLLLPFLVTAVTVAFYFILRALGTASLPVSTLSVATSFLAVYMTMRRSPYYAICYAANDLVLIVLWIIAAVGDSTYISVVACFVAFLANDLYGFVNWRRMERRQAAESAASARQKSSLIKMQ